MKTAKHVHRDRNIAHCRADSVYVGLVLKWFFPTDWKFVVMEKTWDNWNVMMEIWRIEMVVVQID